MECNARHKIKCEIEGEVENVQTKKIKRSLLLFLKHLF